MWTRIKAQTKQFLRTFALVGAGWAAHALTGVPIVGQGIRILADKLTAHSVSPGRALGTVYEFDNHEAASEAQMLWEEYGIMPFTPPYLLEGGGVAIPISEGQMPFAESIIQTKAQHLLSSLAGTTNELSAEMAAEASGGFLEEALGWFGLGLS